MAPLDLTGQGNLPRLLNLATCHSDHVIMRGQEGCWAFSRSTRVAKIGPARGDMCRMGRAEKFFTVRRQFFHDTMLRHPLGVGLTEYKPLQVARGGYGLRNGCDPSCWPHWYSDCFHCATERITQMAKTPTRSRAKILSCDHDVTSGGCMGRLVICSTLSQSTSHLLYFSNH